MRISKITDGAIMDAKLNALAVAPELMKLWHST
jgi:hypothetical protein